ncbi:MAG: putative transport system permease protein [Thermoanaerobaculia bacterium]|jgi:putative ABC transport system permease protein|nr:putative transport system permease protein [Thermoanaerobaculia bacterium]
MILLESILDGIRDIKDHFGRTMLQLVGIILGAGSIVATFSLSVAGKSAAMNYYKVSGGIQKISVFDKPTGKVTLDAKALASKGLTYHDTVVLKREGKEIDLVSPVANENMTLRYRDVEKPRSIMGVTPAYSPMNDFHAGSGRFITDNDLATAARVVVLGTERAQEFFGSDDPIGKTMSINGTGYLVVGVMEEKYFSFDHKRNVMRWLNRQIYIPLTTFVTRKGEPLERGKVSFMHVRMKDVKRNQEAVDEIKAILLRQHGTKDFEVFSRVANLRRNEQNNQMYDMTFMVCGIISLLVGGMVVMNIQLASFNERVREVGTRKAVGASPAQIFFQFLSETILVSVVGGFLGIIVGRFFTAGIAALTRDPAEITVGTAVWAIVFAAGTGLVFGMYPAIRASRLNPIEALRAD